jgi:virginiamycin B lyase
VTAGRGLRSRFVALAVAAVVGAAVLAPFPHAGAAPIGTVTTFCARGDGPTSIATGPDGKLWFTNLFNASIGRMTTSGATTTFNSPGPDLVDSAIYTPVGITPGPDGNLWYLNYQGDSVGRITATGALTRFAHATINQPVAITAGPDGALWFTNTPVNIIQGQGSIGRITTGGVVSNFTDPGIQFPGSITAGPDGNLWFTNAPSGPFDGSIGRITPSGTITIFDDPTIIIPRGIAAGPDGALWFTNSGNNTIGRITTAGVVTNFTHPTIHAPSQITAGPDGNLWYSNGTNAIGRITTAGVVTNFPNSLIDGAFGVTVGPDSNLWFANRGSDSIGRFLLTATPPPPPGFQITSDTNLPCAQVAHAYSATLAAAGGTPPYRWKKISKLPQGLRLNRTTGVISGTPKKRGAGTYSITIQLSDSKTPRPRRVTTKTFALTVDICRMADNPKARC